MALEQSGIELVAKNADRFLRDTKRVADGLKNLDIALDSVTKQSFDGTLKRALTPAKQLGETLDKLARAGRKSGEALARTADESDAAENSIKKLRERAKDLKQQLEKLDRSDEAFERLTAELKQTNSEIKQFNSTVRGSVNSIEAAEGSYRQLQARLSQLKNEFKELSAVDRNGAIGRNLTGNIQQLDTKLKSIDRNIGQFQRNVGNYRSAWSDFASEIPGLNSLLVAGLAGGLAIVATKLVEFASDSRQTAIDFEAAFTGVAKTVDGVADAAGNLTDSGRAIKQELLELARVIPVTFESLAGIAELGGQLGVQADSIVQFTETIALLGATTNLTEEQAGTALAQLANILGSTSEEIERTGSALVKLGNNSATTETEIVNFASRIAAMGAVVGLTEADILGISAAFASVGISAEAGGTAVSKGLNAILVAVSEGGTALDEFARIAGQTSDDFADLFRADAAEAFKLFVEGLQGEGDAAATTLKELGLGSSQATRAFLALSSAGDLLDTSLDLAASGFAENTALAEEAAKQFANTENQTVLLSNAWQELKNNIGEGLKGTDLVGGLADELNSVNDAIPEGRRFRESRRELLRFGDAGFIAAASIANAANAQKEFEKTQFKTDANVAALRLLEAGFEGTAREAAKFATAVAEANQIAGTRTGETSGPLTLDAQLAEQTAQAIERIGGAATETAESNEELAESFEEAEARAKALAEAADNLRSALQSVSDTSFQQARSIITDLTLAEDAEGQAAQVAALEQNRRDLIANLLNESGDLTFDQTIDVQLAFGQISLEEAELLRIEQQFNDAVNGLFGAASVIELDDRAVSIGSLIVQNSGADVAAEIGSQIEQLVTSGQGQAVDAVIEIVPQLVASGSLAEDQIGTFVNEILSSINGGASTEAAIQIAVEAIANTEAAEANVARLQGQADALASGEYGVQTSTNATETAGEIDLAQLAADLLDATDPNVTISTNAGSAKGEIDTVAAAISLIERNVIVNIVANRIGNFSDQEYADAAAGFMTGGYTGDGPLDQIAGVVHRQEFVVSKALIDRGPLAVLGAMALEVPDFTGSPAIRESLTNNTTVVNNNTIDRGQTFNNNIGSINARQQTARQILSDFDGFN